MEVNTNYFNNIPIEILSLICSYINIDDVQKFIVLYSLEENKYFWKQLILFKFPNYLNRIDRTYYYLSNIYEGLYKYDIIKDDPNSFKEYIYSYAPERYKI